MAERSGFFNAKPVTDEFGGFVYHEDGAQAYDREYTAAEFAGLFAMYMTNGIRNGGENLKVTAEGGTMNVKLLPGDAMIEGYYYKLEDDILPMAIETVAPGYARIDRVVLRLDLREGPGRKITAEVIRGVPGEEPKAPFLTRSGGIYELCLGEIFVSGESGYLSEKHITDTRFDKELCGLINSLISVDTTSLLDPMDIYFEEKKGQWEGWFQEVKGTLWQSAYADFYNWAHMAGYTYVTQKMDAGGISEKITGTASGGVLAEKTTEKKGEEIVETLIFHELSLKVKKCTYIDKNGEIISKIEVVE